MTLIEKIDLIRAIIAERLRISEHRVGNHGDLKPQNILLGLKEDGRKWSGRVQLCDFDSASNGDRYSILKETL